MEKLLEKLYYDPKTGYVGMQKLYEKAKLINEKINLKDVKAWYSKQLDIQRFQEQKNKFSDFKITSTNPNSWQIDLAFFGGKSILTAININSRIAFAKLLQNKKADTVLKAIKVLVKENVDIITSDNGKEFMNQTAQKYFKTKGITHYNNEAGDHSTMGKIERFNRTLKGRLTKIDKPLTVKLLSDVISNYNNTKHRSIGMTPNEAKGEVIESELTYNNENMDKLENELDVGSSVLYRLKKKQFEKESARWSKAVYSIIGIDGYRVQIRSKNGHTLYKSPNDIKLVSAESTNAPINKGDILEADRILEHKRQRNGKYKYLIKWLGDEPSSWEPEANLRLIQKNKMSKLEEVYWAKH